MARAAAAPSSLPPASEMPEFTFAQCFGDRDSYSVVNQDDVLSVVAFSNDGEYLATGDWAGRIVVFREGEESVGSPHPGQTSSSTYNFYAEFQSHMAEFDYLKSLEISEKINKIVWTKHNPGNAMLLLTSNEKTVKLWKISERHVKHVSNLNFAHGRHGGRTRTSPGATGIKFPAVHLGAATPVTYCCRTYANAHAYHINSLAALADGTSVISADDLRINLWNLERGTTAWNVVDTKPEHMDMLSEVISCAAAHPTEGSQFLYGTSRGIVRTIDLRAPIAEPGPDHVASVQTYQDEPSRLPSAEMACSLSCIEFCNDDQFATRDFMSLKVWDRRVPHRPVSVINVHDHLKYSLMDCYENEAVFDKFECSASPHGKYLATGSYNSQLRIYDVAGNTECVQPMAKGAVQRQACRNMGVRCAPARLADYAHSHRDAANAVIPEYDSISHLDFSHKLLSLAWHPRKHTLAIAALNNLFIWNAKSMVPAPASLPAEPGHAAQDSWA